MARPPFQNLAPRMRPTGAARDPRVAAELDLLKARIAIGHQLALEVPQELIGPVAMPADREVEHVERQLERAVGPHAGIHARLARVERFLKDFLHPPRTR